MVELRWLIRDGFDGPERILQYRQKIANVYRDGYGGAVMNYSDYSVWQDVPLVNDNPELIGA